LKQKEREGIVPPENGTALNMSCKTKCYTENSSGLVTGNNPHLSAYHKNAKETEHLDLKN